MPPDRDHLLHSQNGKSLSLTPSGNPHGENATTSYTRLRQIITTIHLRMAVSDHTIAMSNANPRPYPSTSLASAKMLVPCQGCSV
jgi:hypothetical protein